jgi:hypothetical protein
VAEQDPQRLQREFMALSLPERRAIIRAVNRGQVVAEKKHARFAVVVARRQQRFWRYAWLLGPALAIVQFFIMEPEAALLNGGFGTIVLGGLARFWYVRAVRSEQLNREVAERRGGKRRAPDARDAGPATGRRRGGAGRRRDAAGGRDGSSPATAAGGADDRPWRRRIGRRGGGTAATSVSSGGGGHLPGEDRSARPAPRRDDRADVADDGPAGDDGAAGRGGATGHDDPAAPPPPGQRPYRPRGNKRRR